jgi:hypothetical protein
VDKFGRNDCIKLDSWGRVKRWGRRGFGSLFKRIKVLKRLNMGLRMDLK